MNLLIGFLPPMLTLALTLARHLWYKLRLFRQFAQDGTILTHRGLSFDVNLPLSPNPPKDVNGGAKNRPCGRKIADCDDVCASQPQR